MDAKPTAAKAQAQATASPAASAAAARPSQQQPQFIGTVKSIVVYNTEGFADESPTFLRVVGDPSPTDLLELDVAPSTDESARRTNSGAVSSADAKQSGNQYGDEDDRQLRMVSVWRLANDKNNAV